MPKDPPHRPDGMSTPSPNHRETMGTLPRIPAGPKPPSPAPPPDSTKRKLDAALKELETLKSADTAPTTHPGVMSWLKNWTPQGIVTSLVVLIGALGGAKGVSDIMGSAERIEEAIQESEERILSRIDARQEAQKKAILDDVESRLIKRDVRTAQNSGMIVKLNGGPPGEGWPLHALTIDPLPPEGRFVFRRGRVDFARLPLFTTSTKYGQLPNRGPFD